MQTEYREALAVLGLEDAFEYARRKERGWYGGRLCRKKRSQ